MLDSLEKMLAKGVDNPLLRFGLGKGYLDLGEFPRAAEHLQRCVELDPQYSAAWKLLGKAHQGRGILRRRARPGSGAWTLPGAMATSRPRKK
ncbi:hypothetical protein PHLH5_00350 [Pseudomonas sp. Cab53]|nr:hypothetical protein PHLH5_00350 [Pseudomonas sp. Cab53]